MSKLTDYEDAYLLQMAKQAEIELRERGLFYQPHPKQLIFHNLGALAAERMFLGGNRTGKTVSGTEETAIHLTGMYPDWWQGRRWNRPITAWAASNSGESTRDILQYALLGNPIDGTVGCIPPSRIRKITLKSGGAAGAVDTVYVRHKSGGLSILGFKAFEQGRTKFQGTSRDLIHLDEEPDKSVYTECLLRVMDVEGMIMQTMTPLMGMTEVCQSFMDGRNPEEVKNGKAFVQATWDDNPHLSERERQRLLAEMKPHELEARRKGIPVLGSGKIYPIEEDSILVDDFPIPDDFALVNGFDFGWTNPTACVGIAYDRDNDIVYIYKEYSVSELTPQKHCNNLDAIGLGGGIPNVGDPSGLQSDKKDGEKLLDAYEDAGYQIDPADNAVESGIQEVLQRMQNGRFKVFKSCQKWVKEFRLYQRDEKGRVKKSDDHLMDASRYGVVSGLGVAMTGYAIKAKAQKSKASGGNYDPLFF